MPIAFWCVLVAIFLPYLGTGIAKFTGSGFGPRQNHDPRTFLATLEGYRKRANAFQMNSFEVTPAFAAAVIIAQVLNNAEPATIDRLAIAWITSRLLYLIFYLADLAALRSLAWFIGMGLIAALFICSAG
ncbi:MAPEG family protein [Pseudomonas sp. SCB32]|uniref:MAPEG family protein n=1 Tax=Pseudomonas sp. SCB32 TaxID=2653853 RepID=UPI0012651767|nr:MAPEG family protein [Pseudomonas sp. SCB32]